MERYEDCLAELQAKRRTLNLMVGNGFSMAYDAKIFSYNALQTFIADLNDPVLDKLFAVVKSKNLEVIMQQLHVLSQLLDVFGAPAPLKKKVAATDRALRQGLINSVKDLHPEHVFEIPEPQIAACKNFLAPYLSGRGSVFTANYDSLLYWVLMRGGIPNANDGFGRELLNPEEPNPDDHDYAAQLTWGPNISGQNIHYLHGALHLFDGGIDIEKEAYDGFNYLLQRVEERIGAEEYPIFVSAGSGDDKLAQIMHNKYLEHCYRRLCSLEGSLVVFGFNFGPYDEHIIDALNVAAKHGRKSGEKLFSVYLGAYSPDDAKHIQEIQARFRCKVRVFDSSQVNPWGK
jgi:hypothetical protein